MIKRLLKQTGIGETELAGWMGQGSRSIRHYVKGDRPTPLILLILLEYLKAQPDAIVWFRERHQRKTDA